jgi:ketosteroid isomerase-like protein
MTLLLGTLLLLGGLLAPGFVARAQDTDDSTDEAADTLAIMDLANRFEVAFDHGDIEASVEMWTDDGVFEHPSGTYTGKDAYREWANAFYQQAQQGGGSHHLLTNILVDVEGDTATMTSYLTLIVGVVSPTPVIISGEFTDSVVRVGGEWKFQRRTLVVFTQFGPPPQDQGQGGGATPVGTPGA